MSRRLANGGGEGGGERRAGERCVRPCGTTDRGSWGFLNVRRRGRGRVCGLLLLVVIINRLFVHWCSLCGPGSLFAGMPSGAHVHR